MLYLPLNMSLTLDDHIFEMKERKKGGGGLGSLRSKCKVVHSYICIKGGDSVENVWLTRDWRKD